MSHHMTDLGVTVLFELYGKDEGKEGVKTKPSNFIYTMKLVMSFSNNISA